MTSHATIQSSTLLSNLICLYGRTTNGRPTLSLPNNWVTDHKPKGLFFASVSVIAVAKKETVRTPKDPDRYLGFGASELG